MWRGARSVTRAMPAPRRMRAARAARRPAARSATQRRHAAPRGGGSYVTVMVTEQPPVAASWPMLVTVVLALQEAAGVCARVGSGASSATAASSRHAAAARRGGGGDAALESGPRAPAAGRRAHEVRMASSGFITDAPAHGLGSFKPTSAPACTRRRGGGPRMRVSGAAPARARRKSTAAPPRPAFTPARGTSLCTLRAPGRRRARARVRAPAPRASVLHARCTAHGRRTHRGGGGALRELVAAILYGQ
jgi:hypothetical protein